MRVVSKPKYELWIDRRPKSLASKSHDQYVKRIREIASSAIAEPLRSFRIEVEIFYAADTTIRADVDNIIKPF